MKSTPRALLTAIAALAMAGGLAWWWQAHRQPPSASAIPNSEFRIPNSNLPLHPVVRQIVEEGPSMPYLKLNYVIKELSTSLTKQDIDALLAFITGPKPSAFGDLEWGSITNDIQEALSVQVVPNEKVARAFIAVARDESRSQLMRDYAFQHIGGFAIYLVHTRHTRGDSLPAFFGDLAGELKSAASDASKPWCGTSLNLLDGLLRAAEYRGIVLESVTPDSLVALAVPTAENSAASLNARLPALQLASRRGAPAALDLARRLLADPESHLMLIQSACAVVGEQGAQRDVSLLEQAVHSGSIHQRGAAQTALAQLHQRFSN